MFINYKEGFKYLNHKILLNIQEQKEYFILQLQEDLFIVGILIKYLIKNF